MKPSDLDCHLNMIKDIEKVNNQYICVAISLMDDNRG